jgi:capsular polysaccharide transport system permease protein
LYYTTGFFPYYFFIYISRRMRGSIDNPNLRFPIEQRLDHIIVHVILRIIDYAILGLLMFGFLYLFTPEAIPEDPTKIAGACAAIVGLGFGWGTVNLVVNKLSRFWGYVMPSIGRMLMIFSGVVFVPDFLLPDIRDVLSYNPLLHAVALFRLGFFPQYPAIMLDVHYLTYCAIFFVLFGLIAERITRRFEER